MAACSLFKQSRNQKNESQTAAPGPEWSWLCFRFTSPTLNLEWNVAESARCEEFGSGNIRVILFLWDGCLSMSFWWSIWTSWSTLLDIQMSKPNTWSICQNYWKAVQGTSMQFHMHHKENSIYVIITCIHRKRYVEYVSMFPDSFLLPKSTEKTAPSSPGSWSLVGNHHRNRPSLGDKLGVLLTYVYPWYLAGVL